MLPVLILYVAIGCGYCEEAKKDLAAACIPYTISTASEPNGISPRPVLEGKGVLLLGEDQIKDYTDKNNQCRK